MRLLIVFFIFNDLETFFCSNKPLLSYFNLTSNYEDVIWKPDEFGVKWWSFFWFSKFKQIVELEDSIQSTQDIVTDRILKNKKDQERNICRIKSYIAEIKANEQTLKSTEKLVNRLIDVYKESCDSNYDIFQTLRVDTTCTERLDMNGPPNEGIIFYPVKWAKNWLLFWFRDFNFSI